MPNTKHPAEIVASQVVDFLKMNPTVKATDPILREWIIAQVKIFIYGLDDDKRYAKAFFSSTNTLNDERIIVDVKIKRDPDELEDVAHTFDLALRKLRRDVASRPVAEPTQELTELAAAIEQEGKE